MKCILKMCKFKVGCSCLGECGARHILREAAGPDGYLIFPRNNDQVDALKGAGLVTVGRMNDDGHARIGTTEAGLRRFAEATE